MRGFLCVRQSWPELTPRLLPSLRFQTRQKWSPASVEASSNEMSYLWRDPSGIIAFPCWALLWTPARKFNGDGIM